MVTRINFFIILFFLLSACEKGSFTSQSTKKYIVVYKQKEVQIAVKSAGKLKTYAEVVAQLSEELAVKHSVKMGQRFAFALQGSVVTANQNQLVNLKKDPLVAYVEEDRPVSINTLQQEAVWGLDRLDQGSLPLDSSYEYGLDGSGVNAYVIDTGININHQEFNGRALHGYDFVDDDANASDCNGHGTHVAGTLAGETYGVAKGARVFAVRVLDCVGSGSYSDVVAGVEWVTANHIKPAVVNMSLGGGSSQALDEAINNSIGAGVSYVVAAGNSSADACNGSPARVARAITVGSSTREDEESSFSNYGECVDLYGPGSDITSAWYTSNSATRTISGTSMASPHVAGVATLYLQQNPNALANEVRGQLVDHAANNKLSRLGNGSPNKLVNVEFLIVEEPSSPPPAPPENDNELENNERVENLFAERGVVKRYVVVLPEGASNLKVSLSGGTGDADLYVRQGSEPSLNDYDCRPYESGNEENCTVAGEVSGVYHIMVRAYSSYTGVNLQVQYENPLPLDPEAPCEDCELEVGNLEDSGERDYLPGLLGFNGNSGSYQVWLEGPDDADFDVYLYKQGEEGWEVVAQSTGLSSSERINYQGSRGKYRLVVHSYRGSGDYKLWYRLP